MKTKMLMIAIISTGLTLTIAGKSAKAVNETVVLQQQADTITFKVYGNCGMCKKTIEGAVRKMEGVKSANWDTDSKMLTVNYNTEKVNELDIHKQVAAAGYDTEKEKASDKDYNSLMGCCKYDRPAKN